MPKTYSVSKINSFNSCKLKYKYQYIDKIKSDAETIERFMGSVVHEALEEFYNLVKEGRVEPVDWILEKYREIWIKKYNRNIKIVRKELSVIDYFKKGGKSLRDYYENYKPFSENKVINTEIFEKFEIENGKEKYNFCGILDRLDWNDKENVYEIHDYKVSNSFLNQNRADEDWQLGLYCVALSKKWPDMEKAKLIWHYLLFNKEVVSFRKKKELKKLQEDVIKKVKEIENCQEFPPQKSGLCHWCDYQNICPLWKN
jgi:putative RecB family exonuclease